jgi:hypothetical protein
MAYIPGQQQNTGLFIESTAVFDVSRLYEVDVNSDEFKELLVRLYQNVNNIALALNLKESALYLLEEFNTSAQYFDPATNNQLLLRPQFRRTYNIGAVAAGVTIVAHGLTIGATWIFTDIYGALTDNIVNNYYPLPWASAGGATNIELRVDAANIVITNNSGIAFTSCIVTLEYLKN